MVRGKEESGVISKLTVGPGYVKGLLNERGNLGGGEGGGGRSGVKATSDHTGGT